MNLSFQVPVREMDRNVFRILAQGLFLSDYVAIGSSFKQEPIQFFLDETGDTGISGQYMPVRRRKGELDIFSSGANRLAIRPGGPVQLVLTNTPANLHSFPVTMLVGYAMSYAFACQGGLILHGAAFEINSKCFLALGGTHSGKSTLASVALRIGGRVVSDDLLLAGCTGDNNIRVEALRKDLLLRSPTQWLLPNAVAGEMRPAIINNNKRWVVGREKLPDCFLKGIQPDIIINSRVDRRLNHSRLTVLSQAEVFSALVQSSSPLFFSSRYQRERDAILPTILQLAQTVPGYGLRLGKILLTEPEKEMNHILSYLAER